MNADHPQRALFVVYDFPPEGARGTKRTIKFCRYLPSNGWSAVVLTVQASPNQCSADPSLFAELPEGLPVYRARTLESLFHAGTPSTPSAIPQPFKTETPAPLKPSVIRRCVRAVYKAVGRFTRIPDARILWAPFAVRLGLKAIREHQCKVIYSSGPTHTNHLVGAILSRLTGLPLVMDFRDAWVGNPAGSAGNWWIRHWNSWMEYFCVRTARCVVCTTDGIQEDFKQRYPKIPPRYVTITNGFDHSDFASDNPKGPPPQSDTLCMLHAGTLGEERSPREFLQALGELGKEHPTLRDQIRVVFVGKNTPFDDGCTIEQYLEMFQCGPMVKIAGYVSRKESLEYMIGSHVLLLIIGRVPKAGAFVYGISGKLYDYAAASRPVLTVSEPGSTASVAHKLTLGPVVNPDHLDQLKTAVLSLWKSHRAGGIPYHPNLELLKSFEFSSLASKLAETFSGLVRSKKP